MLKESVLKILKSVRRAVKGWTAPQLIRVLVMVVIVAAVIAVIILIRSDTSPLTHGGGDGDVPLTPSQAIDTPAPEVSGPASFTVTPPISTPAATPTEEPPAITPPADENSPTSDSDIDFNTSEPSTDTDISDDEE